MKLWEAMKALEEGKKVRRVDWEPYEYIYIDSYNEVINNYGSKADNKILDNIYARWEIYKDKGDIILNFGYLPVI